MLAGLTFHVEQNQINFPNFFFNDSICFLLLLFYLFFWRGRSKFRWLFRFMCQGSWRDD